VEALPAHIRPFGRISLSAPLVVITRPLGRILPPVWSSIAALLVAFHPDKHLIINDISTMKLEL
jgi:hypothetical protein